MLIGNASYFEQDISREEKSRIRKEVKRLSILNQWRSIKAITFNWIIIAIAIASAYYFADPFVYIVAVVIIGTRQHGLLLLMHEAAHDRLAKSKKTNLLLSDLFCAYPLFITTSKYRNSHLAHHKYKSRQGKKDERQ